MSVTSFLYGLGSVPMFAARPFLAGLVTALLARYGTHLPLIGGSDVVQALQAAPAWFTSTWFLLTIGALAVLEALSSRSSEVRAVLDEIDPWLKAGVALLVSLSLVGGQDEELIRSIQRQGLLDQGWSLIVAGTVFVVARLRQALVAMLTDMDEGDDVGLLSALHWAETSWTVLGLLFLVVFPIVAVVLAALTTLGLHLARKRAQRLEEESKVPCASCGARIHASATCCPACSTAVALPRAVGVFGQPRRRPAPDLEHHRFLLVARKRCPSCASRLTRRAVRQPCPTCARVTFAGPAELETYLAALRRRLPATLLVCLAFSAVPLLGVIPGVIYYRLALVSGLRGYIPPLRGLLARVTVRFVNWGLIAVQPVPLAGALIVPLMCATNYLVYRRALVGRAREELPLEAPGTAPA